MAAGKLAIFYITEKGHALAQRLAQFYPEAGIWKFNAETVGKIWDEYPDFVFIMAAGIVVRAISPLMRNKHTDPAVVVMDEAGNFAVSLLGGHLGGANLLAEDISAFLGAEAVITTASDINHLPAIDLWARENDLKVEDCNLLPHVAAKLINTSALKVYSEIDINLPDEFQKVSKPEVADVLITNKKLLTGFYLRPQNLVVGIGCNRGASEEEIEDVVRQTLEESNLAFLSLHSIATIDLKADEVGLDAFARKYGLEIVTFTPNELNQVTGITESETVFKATGAKAVAEPAALLAAGANNFLVPKRKAGNVTVAVAEKVRLVKKGKIYVVGTGPGSIEHITPYALNVIRKSDVIVGYGKYLELIRELIKDKPVFSSGMTQEVKRCEKAIELALAGKTVSIICGGDPGIYALAGPVLEILQEEKRIPLTLPSPQGERELEVEIVPGISAVTACAARLGAPLMHDFACISLSDRLTPWELIEKRLEAAASADFVIVLFNPKSQGRAGHIRQAIDIVLKHRTGKTPVGIVKGAMREGERIIIASLGNIPDYEIDMQTTVIIGNSQTSVRDNRMITPRGYNIKPPSL